MTDPTRTQTPTADPNLTPATDSAGDPLSTAPGGPTSGGPPAPDDLPGYTLGEEIARGGMGIVYRGRDVALDREVAVKLLQPKFPADGPSARRFVDEARITGQLQHPGIPPIHHVGTAPDGRPFLAMKLIKGRTLDALLKDRGNTNFVAVFESIAQAVGYAHAHGVLHRDLKPANVMVGAFGEVQVMDWGLAKVLDWNRGRQGAGGRESDPDATLGTEIRSLRDTHDETHAGSVMGTPAFMPPEQAIGAIDQLDRRTDVFGLGAVLCVVLTGRPPYVGETAESTRQLAARAKLDGAFAALDGCRAEPELVALCKRCLSAEKTDRPADAGAVAALVHDLRTAADERAKQAELSRARAEVQAGEQRKRWRVVQWAGSITAAVLTLGVVGTSIGLVLADAARRDAVAAAKRESEERQKADAATLREVEERTNAEAAKTKAEAKEAEAYAVVKFFEDHVFSAGRPKGEGGGLGHDVPLRVAIEASLPALGSGFAAQPLVEARLRLTLGITFFYLGQPAKSAEQFESARTLYTRHRGPDHPDTLRSMHALANSYGALNRHAEALKLREETLAARKRVLPPDHPDTLLSMTNLAISYRVLSYHDLNRHAEVLKLREETLAAQKRVLPPDHPNTLLSMHALAESYTDLKRHTEALKLHEEVLAARKRVSPPDHPDTLRSMHALANSYGALNRHAEALKLREETLAARKRVLPPDHPDTLWSMRVTAESLCTMDRSAEAIPLIDDCVARAMGTTVHPMLLPIIITLRMQHFQKIADPAECRVTAAMWEKLQRTDADSLYNAACFRAIAAGYYAKRKQPTEATADADRAMELLNKAVTAGWKDAAHIRQDTDLDPLREREDFRTLLADLEAKFPPKREVLPAPRKGKE